MDAEWRDPAGLGHCLSVPRQPEPRRIDYPDQATYPGAYVVLPGEWLGAHLLRRDEAVRATAAFNSESLRNAAIALAVADEWGGVPGITGKPDEWDLRKTPVPLLMWLEREVFLSFAEAFVVPKASAPPSTAGPRVTPNPDPTAGG